MSFAEHVHGAALRLIELLERHGTPYAMMGGVAVAVFGIPRATCDVDVTLTVDEAGLERFLARAAGFEVDEAFRRGFRDVLQGMEKTALRWPTSVEVDVFLVSTGYQKSAFSRRAKTAAAGRIRAGEGSAQSRPSASAASPLFAGAGLRRAPGRCRPGTRGSRRRRPRERRPRLAAARTRKATP